MRPLLKRLASDKRPAEGNVELPNDFMNKWMPAGEIERAFFLGAGFGPGFAGPFRIFDEADEVEQDIAADRIGDDMAAGADPIGADWTAKIVGLSLSIGASPRQAMRPVNSRFGRLKHLLTQLRMNAIRADQDITTDTLSVRQQQFDHSGVLLETDGSEH